MVFNVARKFSLPTVNRYVLAEKRKPTPLSTPGGVAKYTSYCRKGLLEREYIL